MQNDDASFPLAYDPSLDESRFAQSLVDQLDIGIESLSYDLLVRLEMSRHLALSRIKAPPSKRLTQQAD